MTGGDLLRDIERAREAMLKFRPRPNVLIVSPMVARILEYNRKSRVTKEWIGARRWVGPDGKTWIEKRWRTANVAVGGGHKAARRSGLVYRETGWGDGGEWVKGQQEPKKGK